MKNYYEILEVDRKASQEVIEKAYKTLVKKYHPDLQNNEEQKEYEEKMKEINEAYSVLTDDYKKTIYDQQLENTVISRNEYEKVIQENGKLRNELDKMARNINNNFQNTKEQNENYRRFRSNEELETGNTIINMGKVMQEQIQRAYKKAYDDAYIQDMKNRGYKIEYKHDFKYYIKFAGCMLFIFLVFALLYQIPVVKKYFLELYNENLVIRAIVNIFKNVFSTKLF